MSKRLNAFDYPFILWVDYGSEGWSPHGFSTEAELADALIHNTAGIGNSVCPTRRLDLKLEDAK